MNISSFSFFRRRRDPVAKVKVFFDTSLLVELLYKKSSTKTLSAQEKIYYSRVADRCNGHISPITLVEFFYHSFVRRLLEQGSNRPLDLMEDMTILPIDDSTAAHYLGMDIPHNRRPGELDAWQIVLADMHGCILGTIDKGMRMHAAELEVPFLSPVALPI